MSPKQRADVLVWVDLEMTGLDPRKCKILEIAAVITDSDLEVLAQSPAIAIHYSDKVLDGMEAWSRYHHKKSGLTDACRASRVGLKRAEEAILKFVKGYCKQKTAPLCGNTIWQDRRFLVKYMPKLESYLHYRTIDVSSIKELVQRWYSADYKMPRQKNQTHRVLDDILESIEELRHYRKKVFVQPR
ncbi:MAG: Oligoribonuclease [Candidatus Omnitrophica bacterium]|nr:Oligoribonuclease [Candidatus Omnitrophota bacterium]